MRLSILLALSQVPPTAQLSEALTHLLCYKILKRIHIRAARITHALPDNMTGTDRSSAEDTLATFQLLYCKQKLGAHMYSAYYNLAPEPICELFSKPIVLHTTVRKIL